MKRSADEDHLYRQLVRCGDMIGDGRREFLVSGKGKALVRMGLVEMKPDPVIFWFERYQQEAL